MNSSNTPFSDSQLNIDPRNEAIKALQEENRRLRDGIKAAMNWIRNTPDWENVSFALGVFQTLRNTLGGK